MRDMPDAEIGQPGSAYDQRRQRVLTEIRNVDRDRFANRIEYEGLESLSGAVGAGLRPARARLEICGGSR